MAAETPRHGDTETLRHTSVSPQGRVTTDDCNERETGTLSNLLASPRVEVTSIE